VSGEVIRSILRNYAGGRHRGHVQPCDGAVESLCDDWRLLRGVGADDGTTRSTGGLRLQQRFLDLVGFTAAGEESLAWLRSSSGSS
jgi:ABC-2 type transport system ATP-binding protein